MASSIVLSLCTAFFVFDIGLPVFYRTGPSPGSAAPYGPGAGGSPRGKRSEGNPPSGTVIEGARIGIETEGSVTANDTGAGGDAPIGTGTEEGSDVIGTGGANKGTNDMGEENCAPNGLYGVRKGMK